MIPDDVRHNLVACLMDLPGADDSQVRTTFLSNIAAARFFTRIPGNAHGDLIMMVNQLDQVFGPNGEWTLVQFVDDAQKMVAGTDLGSKLAAIRAELLEAQQGIRSVTIPSEELAQIHLFDLRRPVHDCIGQLPADPRTTGVALKIPAPRLLGHFCDSVKHWGTKSEIWSRNDFWLHQRMVINPVHTTIEKVLSKVNGISSLLSTKHVLWPIFIDNTSDAETLWNRLAAAFSGSHNHHLVIAFGMLSETAPSGMVLLPSPRITAGDISKWIKDIVRTLEWHEGVAEEWTRVMLVDYAEDNDDLPIDLVYERLEFHIDLIKQYPTEGELIHALRALQPTGVS